MSISVHQRPGVYSTYDASTVVSGNGGGRVVGLAAVSAAAAAGGVQIVTSYDRAVELFGSGGAEDMAELIRLALKNGASAVAAVPVAGEEGYEEAFARLAGMEDIALVLCGSTDPAVQKKLRDSVAEAASLRRERLCVLAGDRDESVDGLIERARELNVGFINMKSLAGGAIEDARLALRFAAANPNVSVVLPGMYSPEEVAQNAAAVADASPLTEEELAKAEALRRELGASFCRRCGYCAPCTVNIDIPNNFIFHGYLSRYGLADWARGRYNALAAHASDCVACGACEERCPYQLPIREMLKRVAADFGR